MAGSHAARPSRREFAELAAGLALAPWLAAATARAQETPAAASGRHDGAAAGPRGVDGYAFTPGTREDRGFAVDDELATPDGRALHLSLHVPEGYDGGAPLALYVACPGWEGLYFQGVGANLQEDYPFVAGDYIRDMVVATPQLDDWGEQSARDVISLTEWLLAAFNIDPERVYLSGVSGGGETISLVLGMRPELYRRALNLISRWDGDVERLADTQTPVYLAIGEDDDYYGSQPAGDAYERICDAYRRRGVPEDRIAELVTLDVKPASYFEERGWPAVRGQHGGGGALFAHDEQIMGWLFERQRPSLGGRSTPPAGAAVPGAGPSPRGRRA